MKIKLIVEDFYGVDFLKNVIERLKDANLVNKNLLIPKPKHIPADCNGKLDEILTMFDNTCDKIIIVFDADDPRNYKNRYERAQSHVPNNMATPVEIILTEYEIEEWICISKNLNWKQSKPSKELKNKFGYLKSSLPKYANELDFDELQKKCNSFKAFLKSLMPLRR
ncbi:MAG: hypothetical protein O8C63_07260 [Candidatus Methanoperedens sp.]|nr:hypothetical protein [Candidatus Methanoperedens sp.]